MSERNVPLDGAPKVWVITWMYHDRSGSGFIRAFDDAQKARNLLDLLMKHGDPGKAYCIDHVDIEREYA